LPVAYNHHYLLEGGGGYRLQAPIAVVDDLTASGQVGDDLTASGQMYVYVYT
jgi:hypothetical protein